jgi:hypothetical protein
MSPKPNRPLNWPVVFDDGKRGRIPERQVNSATEDIKFRILGDPVEITGGFMEPHGHSNKGPTYAILGNSPQTIQTLPASDRNIGIGSIPLWKKGNRSRLRADKKHTLKVTAKLLEEKTRC